MLKEIAPFSSFASLKSAVFTVSGASKVLCASIAPVRIVPVTHSGVPSANTVSTGYVSSSDRLAIVTVMLPSAAWETDSVRFGIKSLSIPIVSVAIELSSNVAS